MHNIDAIVSLELLVSCGGNGSDIVACLALDLDEQRHLTVDQIEHLGERGHLLIGIEQSALRQLGIGHLLDVAVDAARAQQALIM